MQTDGPDNPPGQSGGHAKVLLIEDDNLVRETLANILELARFSVTSTNSGDDGLAELRQGNFDVVITDIIMPGKEGIETILDIRRDHPDQKIIAISGGTVRADIDYLTLAEKLGANAVLQKPINRQQLLDSLASLLD